MEQSWPFHLFYVPQNLHYLYYIVAVEWTEITYIETLENILLLGDEGLQRVAESYYRPLPVFCQKPLFRKYPAMRLRQRLYPAEVVRSDR